MSTEAALRQFPCTSCGAKLEYAPGTTELKCPYCGAENHIIARTDRVSEMDYLAALRQQREASDHIEHMVVNCEACGATTTLPENVTAATCPFCGSAVVTKGEPTRLIKPQCVLPFAVTGEKATQAYSTWLGGLWFAPNSLKREAISSRLRGVYIPAWTYDCNTTSDYVGERGEDYWETETYTTTENGKTVTRTREVRKTRWYPAAGTVNDSFDDLLVLAARTLPRKQAEALEPWDLKNLVNFQDEYLAGFVCQSYEVDLEQGFGQAKGMMEPTIEGSVRSDIGGDHQRICSISTAYDDITFKHLVLPMWIASYRYQGQVYRFLVNARTGEVQGERPYSWVKIAMLVLAILSVVLIVVLASQR